MKKELSAADRKALLATLKARFEKHPERHKGIAWEKVQEKLEAHPAKLWSLQQMEETEGEPDVVGFDKPSGTYIFMDCSPETPKGRRNVCFDRKALDDRKTAKPHDSAMEMAAAMGIDMLDEEQYRALQAVGPFDQKTSSWIQTPAGVRKLGGALFGDYRYGQTFIYHNGASSYYAVRGFRGVLTV